MEKQFRTLISTTDLAGLLQAPDVAILDCRFSLADTTAGERAYRSAHIPGAHYAHLERDLSSPVVPGKTGRHPLPNPERLTAWLGGLGVSATTQLVAYDDAGGAMAARLWWLARWLGLERIAVLDGGYPAWLAEGRPVTAEIPPATPRALAAMMRPELVVDAASVEAALGKEHFRLLDARAEERFRGDVEPLDPVAGHIPSARCLPFSENLREGRFRSPEELRARYEAALGGVEPENAVVYCGSGVTACHHLLAATHAGVDGMKLYAGSWSEWITDPARPIARGNEPSTR